VIDVHQLSQAIQIVPFECVDGSENDFSGNLS